MEVVWSLRLGLFKEKGPASFWFSVTSCVGQAKKKITHNNVAGSCNKWPCQKWFGFFFQTKKKMLNPFSFWVDEDDITRRSQTPTYMLPDGQQQLGSGVRVVVV